MTSRQIAGLMLTALGLAGGCSDVVTFSKDARKEGLKLYANGQYTDAAGAFRNATRQNPLDYQSFYYYAQSCDQIDQHPQAWSAYYTALQINARALKTSSDGGFRATILNGYAASVARYDTRDSETNVIEQRADAKSVAENSFLLAKVYAYRGDADSAITAYGKATALAPNNFDIAKEFGLYLTHAGQKDRALPTLRRAYTLNSNDAEVVSALQGLGVVVGPSIKPEGDLAKPLVPLGPIPEVHLMNRGAAAAE